jgi:hypothetical protein
MRKGCLRQCASHTGASGSRKSEILHEIAAVADVCGRAAADALAQSAQIIAISPDRLSQCGREADLEGCAAAPFAGPAKVTWSFAKIWSIPSTCEFQQINNCAYRLDTHTRDLLRRRQNVEKLAPVQAWAEADMLFDLRERASCARLLFIGSVASGGQPQRLAAKFVTIANQPISAESDEMFAIFFTSDAASHGPRATTNYNEP